MNNGPALSVCAGPYILYSQPWLAPVDLLVHKAENCLQSWNGYFSIHISEISGPSFNQKSNSMSQDDGHWVPSSFPFSLQESLCLCCISLGFCNSDNKNRLKTWTCTRLLASKKIRLHLRNCTSAQTSDLIFFGSPLAIHLFFFFLPCLRSWWEQWAVCSLGTKWDQGDVAELEKRTPCDPAFGWLVT